MAKLITGGTGFVGAELARILVERGEDVVLFDRTIKRHRIADIADQVKLVQGDLGNRYAVFNLIKEHKITQIYHLGSTLTFESEAQPWVSFEANVVGTFNIIEAARLFDVERLMFTSSVGTYSLEVGDVITDTTIQRPSSMYGVGKLYCEGLGRFYRNKFGLDFRSIRYPTVLGLGDKNPGHWAPQMIEEAVLGKHHHCAAHPESTTVALFFKDAARAADMVLRAPKEAIKMVNYSVTGNSSPISAQGLEEAIKRQIPDAAITYQADPAFLAYRARATTMRYLDDSCARKEWGWEPAYPTFDDMIRGYIEEVRDHPERYV